MVGRGRGGGGGGAQGKSSNLSGVGVGWGKTDSGISLPPSRSVFPAQGVKFS